jgi:type III secretory pathway component EscU
METLKKIVNILVMIYLVLAVLIYLDILNLGQNTNPGFYTNFFVAGGFLMLLELIVENIYIMTVKRGFVHHQNKINELKASLYDQKQELQDLKNKHTEEITAIKAAQVQHPKPNQYAKETVMVPPPTRNFNEPGTRSGNSAQESEIFITPAPIPPAPINPENYPLKNSDSDTHREPNH